MNLADSQNARLALVEACGHDKAFMAMADAIGYTKISVAAFTAYCETKRKAK